MSSRFGVANCCLALVALLRCSPCSSYAVDRMSIGGTDFWNIDNNWNPTGQPQPADKAIVGGSPEVTDVEIFNELDNSGEIRITTGTLQPLGDTTNTSTINIGDGSAIRSSFNPGNSTTLSGSGQVILQNSDNLPGSNATIVGGSDVAGAVTNAAGHTIRGEGSISLNWINEGTIIAEETTGDSSAVLRLNNIASFVNNGELRSSPGATINLNFAQYSQGASGQLIADSDNITLTGGTSITGGSLETVGGGVFDTNGLITLLGVTVNAPIDNSNTSGPINDARLYVSGGGITNNSTITIAGTAGRGSQFGFTDPGALDGTGEVVLIGGNNQTFIGVFPGIADEITHGANHTIRGAGAIASPIINNGTIRAEPGTDGATLAVQAGQTNNSRMEAGAGATLLFTNSTFGGANVTQGAGGVIAALDGGTVELNGGSYAGGSFDTTGSGLITLVNNPTLTNVTNRGTLNAPGGRSILIAGSTFSNDGDVTLNSNNINSAGTLSYGTNLTLDGSGEVVLNTPGTVSSRIVPTNNNSFLTHGADHTIRGRGFLSGTIVNQGRIEGNSAVEPITIFANLSGDGPLENVQIAASVFSGFGVHSPGNSTAIVPLAGSYEITSNATLEIELGGLTPGTQHDQLDSSGAVTLGNGSGLDVSLVDLANGYTPMAGDRFDIITSSINDISGTFGANFVKLPQFGLGYELTWQPIDYSDPRKVTLEIATAEVDTKDLNKDGFVDGLDLGILLGNWNRNVSPSGVELNGEVPVDGLDLGILLGSWRPPAAPLATWQAVPEPGTLVSLSIAMVVLSSWTRRKEAR